jgi:type II secretory pathway component GspD/PulD (secretin)
VIPKRLLIRAFILALLALVARGQQPQLESSPQSSPELQATPSPTPENPTLDNLEKALKNQESTPQPELLADPNKPRTHRFTNQPVGAVLRVLAEEADINYIEPNINPEERISLILPAMTPIQAFYAVAEARGFKVVTKRDSNIITLSRSDINAPSYYVMRAYRLRYQAAEDLKQAVAGFLGISVKPVSTVNPTYPPPVNSQPGSAAYTGAPEVNAGAAGGIQTLYSAGTEQSVPRFPSGLPFDNPLSTGGQDRQDRVFIERSTNSIMVNATPDEHEALAAQIKIWDRRENQIQINTYIVEVSQNDDLFGGVDWSNTLGQSGATFTLTGNVGSPPNTIYSQTVGGAFFKSGLILQFPTVQATIRALGQRGKLKSANSPVTYTRTGEPVQIRSVTNQTIFLQTAATANVQATTTPFTFTTGLTIDLVARILAGGIIDMKINPALSTQTGASAAQPGTTTPVPVISTRSATADVDDAACQDPRD